MIEMEGTVEPRLSELLWSPKNFNSQNRSDNENQNGSHNRKSTGERDRQLIALSSTHRQLVVCFSTWINRSEAKRTGYLGYISSTQIVNVPYTPRTKGSMVDHVMEEWMVILLREIEVEGWQESTLTLKFFHPELLCWLPSHSLRMV